MSRAQAAAESIAANPGSRVRTGSRWAIILRSLCLAQDDGSGDLKYITKVVILLIAMSGPELKKARQEAGWTQARLAQRLGVTQAYVSLMEAGKRRLPDRLRRRAVSLLRLAPTCLPMAVPRARDRTTTDRRLEQGLAQLRYPGLQYRRKPGERKNPAELLLMGLAADELDPRLAEGLPWLLLRFEGYDTEDLVRRAKSLDLQNRLGFTVSLARRVAESSPAFRHRQSELEKLEQALEPSRLAREDTYGRRETSPRMREWLTSNRSPDAEHWNLLSDLKPEHLPYAQPHPGALAQLSSGR